MIHLYAPNVHTGGGLVLLRAILRHVPPNVACKAYLDARIRHDFKVSNSIQVEWFERSFLARWHAERRIFKEVNQSDLLLCFHSLPPLFANHGDVVCFMQNAHVIGLVEKSYHPNWVNVRRAIERSIARIFRGNIDRFVVQTPTMRRAVREWLKSSRALDSHPIDVLPFLEIESSPDARPKPEAPCWDFIYVSDGAVHKNHKRLFAAFRLLAEQGLRPSLAVTLPDRDAELIAELETLVAAHGLNITNLGHLPHDQIQRHYRKARAMLFASFAESFGIPMLEATEAGVPILAAELDFVRDMCVPAQTFDPFSEVSIARSIKRFLYDTEDVITVLTPAQFLAELQALSALTASQKSLAS